MAIKFKLTVEIPADQKTVYEAWLNGKQHAAMTGVPATASNKMGGTFTAHDGYAFGKNLELDPYSKIVQSWRTTEFAEDEKDSLLEINLAEKGEHTLLTLIHSQLPPHGKQYEQGWIDFYFEPMKLYFQKLKHKK